jgi:prepilin-type N-terminal cleavage/methylation domain-containing protein
MRLITRALSRCTPKRLQAEAGFTLIELMISIILLAVVSTAFLAATNSVYKGIHKEQGIANALDGNRRALQVLDKQVRYASAINTPGVVAGAFYIEYLWTKTSTIAQDTPTCTQWKLTTDDKLQYRSWKSGVPQASTLPFTTVDTSVINDPVSRPPFKLLPSSENGVSMQYQRLQVDLVAARDTGSVNTASTLTALNTPNSAALAAAVCLNDGISRS